MEFRSAVMHHRVGGKLRNEILLQILGTSGDRTYILIQFFIMNALTQHPKDQLQAQHRNITENIGNN